MNTLSVTKSGRHGEIAPDSTDRESFISVYGRIPRETKGRLVYAARKARMRLTDWCVMVLEREAGAIAEDAEWNDSRGNK